MILRKIILSVVICLSSFFLYAGRDEIKLSGTGWKIWLDEKAEWQKDVLYVPEEVDITKLPVNAPSCGWDDLYSQKGIVCSVPATVEEYFANGNPLFTYHGVSWFWKKVTIPANWKGKKIRIRLAETRLRAEIYVNNKIAGYDLVSETPWETDLSSFLNYGAENIIAVRITNPGGHRGWEDFGDFTWGSYSFPSSHDFGGISGDVFLTATDSIYINNVFVKNILPANSKKVEVNTTIINLTNKPAVIKLNIEILTYPANRFLYSKEFVIKTSANKLIKDSSVFELSDAKLWNVNDPNLYYCRVSVSSGKMNDEQSERFGIRTFEVKQSEDGQQNFYLNGVRFIHKSSIDWGYYAGTGLYATDEMAKKSIKAAKDIGHNGINFHRCIGEPLVMNYADEMGLSIYEEPGGFHAGQQGYKVSDSSFTGKIMEEKSIRMAVRDRNHPSLIMHNLCNEDNYWNSLRERVMKTIHTLNPTVMVSNSSGGYIFDIFQGTPSNKINHIRPYENTIRNDYEDNHTVEEHGGVAWEPFLSAHSYETNNLQYWGEVHCYGGPDNYFATADMLNGKPNWDAGFYKPLHDKILDYFKENNLSECGSKNIKTPADVSLQAGRGMMYINGRAAQNIMSMNSPDGFAINGWTGTSQVVPGAGDYWNSAILDEGRNIKGVASDYAYWTRDLQICIKRLNGKYFQPDEIAMFRLTLINQHKLISPKDYKLVVSIIDGDGKFAGNVFEMPVKVIGSDVYAQIIKDIPVKIKNWNGGYITIEAKLWDGDKVVADGKEQILLRNRASFNDNILSYAGAVYKWDAAKKALLDAKIPITDFSPNMNPLSYICAGTIPLDVDLINMLKRVKEDGTSLIIPFDEAWAKVLTGKGLLTEVPQFAPCIITGSWKGNGWGYLDYYIGNQVVPGVSTIGINSWELGELSVSPNEKPVGFWPLKTNQQICKSKAYGAFIANPDILQVLLGEIEYGKGKIILNASYKVDQDNAFCDMLFYNLISLGSNLKSKIIEKTRACYSGNPIKIPGVVQAENFDAGVEGITYHDSDSDNHGNEYRSDGVDISSSGGATFIGWTETGEWLEYTVDVKHAGSYNVEFHYATPNSLSSVQLDFDSAAKSGIITLPSTGDWFAFRHYSSMIKLNQGKQIMRLKIINGGFNLNEIKFTFFE